jgi:hypothetical protein
VWAWVARWIVSVLISSLAASRTAPTAAPAAAAAEVGCRGAVPVGRVECRVIAGGCGEEAEDAWKTRRRGQGRAAVVGHAGVAKPAARGSDAGCGGRGVCRDCDWGATPCRGQVRRLGPEVVGARGASAAWEVHGRAVERHAARVQASRCRGTGSRGLGRAQGHTPGGEHKSEKNSARGCG